MNENTNLETTKKTGKGKVLGVVLAVVATIVGGVVLIAKGKKHRSEEGTETSEAVEVESVVEE